MAEPKQTEDEKVREAEISAMGPGEEAPEHELHGYETKAEYEAAKEKAKAEDGEK